MLGLNKKDKDLHAAEATGTIKSLPPKTEAEFLEKNYDGVVVDNPEDFRMAVGHAQMAGGEDPFVEVTERLFQYLVKNNKTEYLTYGSPGVKVFKEGTRETILKFEKMRPEEQAIVLMEKAALAKANG